MQISSSVFEALVVNSSVFVNGLFVLEREILKDYLKLAPLMGFYMIPFNSLLVTSIILKLLTLKHSMKCTIA